MKEEIPSDFKSSRLYTFYGKELNESPKLLRGRWCGMAAYGACHSLVSWVRQTGKPFTRM